MELGYEDSEKSSLVCEHAAGEEGLQGRHGWGGWTLTVQRHGWKCYGGAEGLSFSESLIRSLVRTEYFLKNPIS